MNIRCPFGCFLVSAIFVNIAMPAGGQAVFTVAIVAAVADDDD